MIVRQISELLTKQFEKGGETSLTTTLTSTAFLSRAKQILKDKFVVNSAEQVCQPATIVSAYQWLICYILKEMRNKKISKTLLKGVYEKNLATVYLQYYGFQRLREVIQLENNIAPYIKEYLLKGLYLYCLWNLKEFLPFFHKGNYMRADTASRLIQEGISKLVGDLKENCIHNIIDTVWNFKVNKKIQLLLFVVLQLLSTPISQIIQWRDSKEIEKSDLKCKL